LRNNVEESRARGFKFFNKSPNAGLWFKSLADETVIDVYDEIGMFGLSAAEMRARLDMITTGTIRLRINSPGGDAFDGIAIYNDLVNHDAQVIVEITGIAASAASIIAMAGDQILMADNSFMMIHNAWAMAIGDKNTMDQTGQILSQLDGALALTYAQRTGNGEKKILQMMNDETWLDAATARNLGFADDPAPAVDPNEPAAMFDLSTFQNVPIALKQRTEDFFRASGKSRRESKMAASRGLDFLGMRDASQTFVERDANDGDCKIVAELSGLTGFIKTLTPKN